ncbi:type IV pilus modification protein PilV [Endozoicomonas montiporae]|uniref:Type IV fimbrial biogenesis protein PilV n=1 Tax=Endozoicomonas montiporae CL-33 TaxID=570277 RepID=A0A142BAE0_9GAMM|nr:type IV pilus modification protein PilV [Endozoicomonas montiporae]AMO55716.1 type IV fimbrial biogenesis protein PilV [Endozoicomonas montiporae CL-33]
MIKYQAHLPRKKANRGLTLIEVMIATLIVGSGLLGAAALQNQSIQYHNQARLNTLANQFAYDMMNRIIANRTYSTTGTGYSITTGNIPAVYPTTCETSSCTPAQLAQYDINQWKFLINTHLPSGDGTIAFTDTSGIREYTITISFDDSKGQSLPQEVILRGLM